MNLTSAHAACDTLATHTSDVKTNLPYEHRYGLVVRKTFLEIAACEKPSGAVRRVRSVGDRPNPAAPETSIKESVSSDDEPWTPTPRNLIKFEWPSVSQKSDANTSTTKSSISWSSFSDDEDIIQSNAALFPAPSEDDVALSPAPSDDEDDDVRSWRGLCRAPRGTCGQAAPPQAAPSSKSGRSAGGGQDWSGAPVRTTERQGVCNTAARLRSATTVMVQNLPDEMSQMEFCSFVGALGFEDCYDFLYMPTCLSTKKTMTYAFVNLLTPELAIDFARQLDFKGLRWCRAHVQGLDGNLRDARKKTRHIRNATFLPIVRQ